MVWNDNKRPVEFERYRRAPFLLGSKYGWFFHAGEEHANMTTRTLEHLLREEKAYLVIDKAEWEQLVQKYRGAKATGNEKQALTEQRNRLSKQIAALTAEAQNNGAAAQKMIVKDPEGARKMLAKNINLKRNVDDLSGKLKEIEEKLARLK